LKGEILKLSQEGEEEKRKISRARRERSEIFINHESRKQKIKEAKSAKKEIKIITPFSPFGMNTKTAKREPVPAPIKSEK
jgi:hypothetical protein